MQGRSLEKVAERSGKGLVGMCVCVRCACSLGDTDVINYGAVISGATNKVRNRRRRRRRRRRRHTPRYRNRQRSRSGRPFTAIQGTTIARSDGLAGNGVRPLTIKACALARAFISVYNDKGQRTACRRRMATTKCRAIFRRGRDLDHFAVSHRRGAPL